MTTEDNEIQDVPPPSADRVARRALVFAALSCRAFVEGHEDDSDAVDLHARLLPWFKSLDIERECSEWERGVLHASMGTLTDRDRIQASWLSEPMLILAWALGKVELPAFDMQCDPQGVANSLGFLLPSNETVLVDPTLRSKDELSNYNWFIYNIHWRLLDFSLHQNTYDFASLARKAWGEPILRYGLHLVENDISIDELPLPRLSENAFRSLMSITQERHRASNWLDGYASADFYQVTADT